MRRLARDIGGGNRSYRAMRHSIQCQALRARHLLIGFRTVWKLRHSMRQAFGARHLAVRIETTVQCGTAYRARRSVGATSLDQIWNYRVMRHVRRYICRLFETAQRSQYELKVN